MKLVVGYIDRDRFDAIRERLLASGFVSISAWEATGTMPEAIASGTYRGVAMATHLRPKVRMECVAGDEHVQNVVDTVLELAGDKSFVFVVGVENAYPTTTVKAEPAAV